MTVKTHEIVIDALETLIVQASEAPIEQSEAAAAIRALNDMMTQWEAIGINLGYTIVADMADVITVPLGAVLGIKSNLALYLAPKYNVQPTALMLKNASDSYQAVIDISTELASSEYPGNLPQGTGNNYPGYLDNTFYPDLENTILTETGGSVALEEDTEEA